MMLIGRDSHGARCLLLSIVDSVKKQARNEIVIEKRAVKGCQRLMKFPG